MLWLQVNDCFWIEGHGLAWAVFGSGTCHDIVLGGLVCAKYVHLQLST